MLNRLKSSLHEKVHGAKITRQMKQVNANVDNSFDNECETSSASESESESEASPSFEAGGFGVEFRVESAVDLRGSPFYFYVCIGNEGELTARKKRRGIKSSGVVHWRSPALDYEKATFLLPLAGLSKPEVTVRFSRSSIVGADGFLGECHFRILLKGSLDSIEERAVCRVTGGGNAVASCSWAIVPYTTEARRSRILPDESIVTDADKLSALVDSVQKCLSSLTEDDTEREGKLEWIVTLLQVIEMDELNFVFERVSLSELTRLIPDLFSHLEKKLLDPLLSVLVRARVVKCLQLHDESACESLIASVILACPEDELVQLKHILNRGGDRHNLLSLVFSTVQADLLREQIILKFQETAEVPVIHVISEIDQVVHSPFGSVRDWPEGPIPGSRPLFVALSKSEEVTFVSNKPLSFESWTHKLIRDLGMGDAPLLAGARSDLYALRGGLSRLQSRVDCTKYSNWSMYRRLFPEGQFVWFGESLEFARTLMHDERHGVGNIVLAVVMGDLEGSNRVGPRVLERGVVQCGNFIQAAIACVDEGLINRDKTLKDLITEFSRLIAKLDKDCTNRRKRHKHLLRDRVREMKADLERLRDRFTAHAEQEGYREDHVDSLVLTPIEALSPTLTNHSPSPDHDGPALVNGTLDTDAIGMTQF